MTGPEPWWFLAGLLAMLVAGFLLPLRIEGRQDHIVVTITNGAAVALLGPRGLGLLWLAAGVAVVARTAATAVAPRRWLPARAEAARAIGWIGASLLACTAGAVVGIAVYTGGFGGTYPVPLTDTSEAVLAATMGIAAWVTTMAVRLVSQKVVVGTVRGRNLDVIDSPLIPYLLPLVAGYPLIAATIAMYRPADPFVALVMITWCIPIHAASAFDVRRRDLARSLRRDAFARQRLVAIGEVSARVVHQSRHQVGVMGLSIHRLRAMSDRPGPIDVHLLRAELDALSEAKDRLSETLAAELLVGSATTDGSEVAAGDGDLAPVAPTVAAVVADVVRQLRAEADREGVVLSFDPDGPGATDRATGKLHDVVFNLVDNAIDAAATAVHVRLDRTTDGGGRAAGAVVVEDDGPGLGEQERARAFEPFFTTKVDGTGMGLAIADALVGDLGGELRYERAAGRTAFVVVLPAPVPATTVG